MLEPEVLVALLTFLGVVVSSIFSVLGHKNAKAANNAVNNVEDPSQPRIYDLAVQNSLNVGEIKHDTEELIDWKDSFNDSPWASGEDAKQWLEDHRDVLDGDDELDDDGK